MNDIVKNIVKIIIWLFVLVWFSLTFVPESSKVKDKFDETILENGTKAIVDRSVRKGDDVKIYNNTFFNFIPSNKQNPYENTDRPLGYGITVSILLVKFFLQIVILSFGFINLYNNFRPNQWESISHHIDILAKIGF